jgi:hypothetical protein
MTRGCAVSRYATVHAEVFDAATGRGVVDITAAGRRVLHVEFVDGEAIGWDPQGPDANLLREARAAFAAAVRARA